MLFSIHLKPCLLKYSSFCRGNNRVLIKSTKEIFDEGADPYFRLCVKSRRQKSLAISIRSKTSLESDGDLDGHANHQQSHEAPKEKSFLGAVALIVGTAVGPGMLGLPAATVKAGQVPATVAILFSWIYVVSSIILVAELSFAAMEENGAAEVSFTDLANKAFGSGFGTFVALIYASLSFALLVCCVSGIGSLISQWFPKLNPIVANALFPSVVGAVLSLLPFKAIDVANRFLCIIMLFSISALVTVGVFVGGTNILGSFAYASWAPSTVMPAIPIAVLTMGFHVITPFICKIAGNTVNEARKAILVGGAIPLIMVLSWNLIVLGLARTGGSSSITDPISLLLSVNPSALPAVQGFALSALATSLIGYAVSFPKQLIDTMELIFNTTGNPINAPPGEVGRLGLATFNGHSGKISYCGIECCASEAAQETGSDSLQSIVMPIVLAVPVLIASFFPSMFSRALNFAGIYANCFLFGILPPIMTFIFQSRRKLRLSILPGGDGTLLLLLGISVILAVWH
nr:tyrosine-specific transport protein [Ipomoea batatas]GMC97824.1 tyrosine-specific transport protein [Ipomoea batatas]